MGDSHSFCGWQPLLVHDGCQPFKVHFQLLFLNNTRGPNFGSFILLMACFTVMIIEFMIKPFVQPLIQPLVSSRTTLWIALNPNHSLIMCSQKGDSEYFLLFFCHWQPSRTKQWLLTIRSSLSVGLFKLEVQTSGHLFHSLATTTIPWTLETTERLLWKINLYYEGELLDGCKREKSAHFSASPNGANRLEQFAGCLLTHATFFGSLLLCGCTKRSGGKSTTTPCLLHAVLSGR